VLILKLRCLREAIGFLSSFRARVTRRLTGPRI
jgi:hypothetical protein